MRILRFSFLGAIALGASLAAQSVPEVSFDANADLLKLPDMMNFGEVAGVATNSKGHVFVYTRVGPANATLGSSRTFYKAGSKLFEFDQTGKAPRDADLVWLEAPSNPFLTMPDFEAAASHPAPVLCDATAATPVHLRPLERGCDLVLHSATKFLAGHEDVLLGAVVCREAATAERLRELRGRTGAVAAPDVAWLLLRSLPTLELRVARQTESARIIAERLRGHPKVTVVRYPGFGGLLSFDVSDADAARRVETGTRLVANMTSLGGVVTRIEARSRWEGDRVPPGLLRLSVGLEDPEDLWADLTTALEAA